MTSSRPSLSSRTKTCSPCSPTSNRLAASHRCRMHCACTVHALQMHYRCTAACTAACTEHALQMHCTPHLRCRPSASKGRLSARSWRPLTAATSPRSSSRQACTRRPSWARARPRAPASAEAESPNFAEGGSARSRQDEVDLPRRGVLAPRPAQHSCWNRPPRRKRMAAASHTR